MSQARREDYLHENDLLDTHLAKDVSYLFPEKFCGHRWLENVKALMRAIDIHPKLEVYFKFLIEQKKMSPKDERFELVKRKIGFPFHIAILEFSLCIANEIEPFLKIFQAERPLAVFLYEKLKELLCSLMDRFIRPEVLDKENTVRKMVKIDLKDENNLLPVDKVKVGHGANKVLRKATTTQALEVKEIRRNARGFLVRLVEKVKERSPLCQIYTVHSLSPTQISVANDDFLINVFNKLCSHLVDNTLISNLCADRAETSYKLFIRNAEVKRRMKEFNMESDRRDEFYMPLLTSHVELREVVKLVLVLSHGNARVESGISVNEDILIENMKEEALIAQRLVYDGVMNEGGIFNVDINKQMIKDVDSARAEYGKELEKNRENQTAGEKRKLEKRKLTEEMKKAKAAKATCTDELKKKEC